MLMPPAIPISAAWYGIYVLGGFVFFTLKFGIEESIKNPESGLLGVIWYFILGFMVSFLPGLGWGSAIFVVARLVYMPQRKEWKQNRELLLTSGFCQKDGVVIDHQGNAQDPRTYVNQLF